MSGPSGSGGAAGLGSPGGANSLGGAAGLAGSGESGGSGGRTGTRPRDYLEHPLAVEDFVVVVPSDSPLASRPEVRMAQLAEAAWLDNVVYENSPTLRILLTACQAAGFTPRWAARCNDHLAAVGLVAAGLGVTAFPALAHRGMPGTVALPLTDPTPQRELVAWQRGATAHTQASRIALAAPAEVAREGREWPGGDEPQAQMTSGSTRRSRPTR